MKLELFKEEFIVRRNKQDFAQYLSNQVVIDKRILRRLFLFNGKVEKNAAIIYPSNANIGKLNGMVIKLHWRNENEKIHINVGYMSSCTLFILPIIFIFAGMVIVYETKSVAFALTIFLFTMATFFIERNSINNKIPSIRKMLVELIEHYNKLDLQ